MRNNYAEKYLEENRRRLRVVLPGFPKIEPFKTRKEVDKYFSTEKIQCLLCGKHYKRLGNHLQPIHEITEDEYRQRFGLPYSRGLVCPSTWGKYHTEAKNRYERGESKIRTPESILKAEESKAKKKRGGRGRAFYIKKETKQRCIKTAQSYVIKKEAYEELLNYVKKYETSIEQLCKRQEYKHLQLPAAGTISSFFRKNPEYRERYHAIIHSWSYKKQLRQQIVSPIFFKRVFILRYVGGFTQKEIAKRLRVGQNSIHRIIKRCHFMYQDLSKYIPINAKSELINRK